MSDREILKYFSIVDDPVLTTNEVADFLDFSNPGAIKRLHALEDEGYIESKKAGRNPVWWITDDGREYVEQAQE